MRHPAVLLLILGLIAGASWLLLDTSPLHPDTPAGDKVSADLAGHQVDYYLRGLQTTTMGQDGKPTRTLRAEQVKHFLDTNTTELLQPRLTIHQGDQPAWEVQAGSGWVSADGKLILLDDEVRIDREQGTANQPVHITTAKLRVQPEEGYAETDEQVRVRSNHDWLDATGMQVWLRQPSRIKFLADVKAFYAPPQ